MKKENKEKKQRSLWRHLRKMLAMVLALVMVFQLLPVSALAEEKEAKLGNDGGAELTELGSVTEFNETPRREEFTAKDVYSELESLRGEAEKHFFMSDGTSLAVCYGYPVHYLDEKGTWQEIDDSLALYEEDGSLSELPADEYLTAWLAEQKGQTEAESDPELTQAEQETTEGVEEEETAPDEEATAERAEEGEEIPEQSGEEMAAEEWDQEKETEPSEEDEAALSDPEVPGEETGEVSDELPDSSETGIEALEETEEPQTVQPEKESLVENYRMIDGPKDARTFRNAAGASHVRFGAVTSADKLVNLSYKEYELSFTPVLPPQRGEAVQAVAGRIQSREDTTDPESLNAAIMPKNLSASILYENYLPGADLEYIFEPHSLKENIILREPNGEYSFAFLLELGDLKPKETEYGEIELLDDRGERAFRIPAGVMYDAQNEISGAVKYELEDLGEGKYLLAVTADSEWINAPERVFPVTVDPTFYYSGELVETGTIRQYTNSPYVQSWYESIVGMTQFEGVSRTLARINYVPVLPQNAHMISAVLSMYYNGGAVSSNVNDFVVLISELPYNNNNNGYWCNFRAWGDSVNQLADSVTNYMDVLAEGIIGGSPKTVNFDITKAVERWYADPTSNRGLCFYAKDEAELGSGKSERINFLGYQNLQRTNYPCFMVNYKYDTGLENYYTYQMQDIGRAGTGYIQDFNGYLTLAETDVTVASTSCPLTISHVYNSVNSAGEFQEVSPNTAGKYYYMHLGKGWKLNLEQTVVVGDGYGEVLVYTDGDGTPHIFRIKNGAYYDEDGLGLVITRINSGYVDFIMTDQYGNKKEFWGNTLRQIADANGNKIHIYYSDERIASVARQNGDGPNEQIATFNYSWPMLSSIVDISGRTTSFTYDSEGRLTGITHPDGTTVSYTYDSNNKLLSATDNESGYSVHYEW